MKMLYYITFISAIIISGWFAYVYEGNFREVGESIAGSNSIYCGYRKINDTANSVEDCAKKSFMEKKNFIVWYQLERLDAASAYGFAFKDGNKLFLLHYDNYNILPIKYRKFFSAKKCIDANNVFEILWCKYAPQFKDYSDLASEIDVNKLDI